MTDRDPTTLTLDDWIAALTAGKADIAAGHIVPGEVVIAELEQQLARLEARLQQPAPAKAITRR
jgi:predicted transcriptional regulator